MTRNKAQKAATRAHAKRQGISYTAARRALAQPPVPALLPTGIAELDRLLGGGLPRGRLTALWAATGVGTSMFGLTLARAVSTRGQDATIVAAEDGSDLYVQRLAAAEAADGGASPWPPSWGNYLRLYSPEGLEPDLQGIADDLRTSVEQEGRQPDLLVIDDLGALDAYRREGAQILARLARDLGAAVLVIDALPPELCKVPPSEPDDYAYEPFAWIQWPERVPSEEELGGAEETRALMLEAAASLFLTTPGDPRASGEVVDLDLTVRTQRRHGVIQVRRDGPRGRILAAEVATNRSIS
jgi:hypothetical protein